MAERCGSSLEIIRRNAVTVDEAIRDMSRRPISEVVATSEGMRWAIGTKEARNAAEFLVARLFTDAVFSQDIRSIQLIINRIDGGLPKDTEVDDYQTDFGDCLTEIMEMDQGDQLKVVPDDTVMMAMCKSLYSMAVEDIFWDYQKKRPRRPTDAQKKERDAAMRMVLERIGGRKTLTEVGKSKQEIELASWIAELPEKTVDL